MLYPGHWSEQTGVQAAGTKERTTFFLPRYWLSVTFWPAMDGKHEVRRHVADFHLEDAVDGFQLPGGVDVVLVGLGVRLRPGRNTQGEHERDQEHHGDEGGLFRHGGLLIIVPTS